MRSKLMFRAIILTVLVLMGTVAFINQLNHNDVDEGKSEVISE